MHKLFLSSTNSRNAPMKLLPALMIVLLCLPVLSTFNGCGFVGQAKKAVQCKKCAGTGECSECGGVGGTGFLWTTPCERCGGSGKCSGCGGTGF